MAPGLGTIVFAYGSNMLTRRIRERCPSAVVNGCAELRGYRLRWHKKSQDGSGKCDVVSDPPASVFGVLFIVAASEKSALDRAEGLGRGYAETQVEVLADGETRPATLYYATKLDPNLRPYSWYRALVLAGAREHALPEPYLQELSGVQAIEDPDRERHQLNMALLSQT